MAVIYSILHDFSSAQDDDLPMVKAAIEGDAKRIRELIQQGHSVLQGGKDKWMPIHFAAWSVS